MEQGKRAYRQVNLEVERMSMCPSTTDLLVTKVRWDGVEIVFLLLVGCSDLPEIFPF